MTRKYKLKKCDKCNSQIELNEFFVCDGCKKEFERDNKLIIVEQECDCWGNDSIDGIGTNHYCSIECLKTLLNGKAIGNSVSNAIDEKNNDGWAFEIDIQPEHLKHLLKMI